MGEVTVHTVEQISFRVKKGEICTIFDLSDVGKTTVLNLLGGIEVVISGRTLFGSKNIAAMNDPGSTDYRRYRIGFVFQFYSLIPNLTAAESVKPAKQIRKSLLKPGEALRIAGLKDRIHNSPAQLSGGERQRVTIARAVCRNLDPLLYDEPTDTLDTGMGKTTLKALLDINWNMGRTAIITTRNSLIAPIADRLIEIKDGMVIKEGVQDFPADLGGVKW